MAFGAALMVIMGAISVFLIIAMWFVFEKAGQPGWAAIIPIYNFLILIKVAGKEWWWIFGILLTIIPFVGPILILVWAIMIMHGLSKNFGKEAGFTVGLVLLYPVFLAILAFGSAQYQAVGGEVEAAPAPEEPAAEEPAPEAETPAE